MSESSPATTKSSMTRNDEPQSLSGGASGVSGVPESDENVAGPCEVRLIPEYGVIHLRGALSQAGQRHLWDLTKPLVEDPKGKGAGFSCFNIAPKRSTAPRNPDFDRYGHLLYQLCAKGLMANQDDVDLLREPSYKHLADIAAETVSVQLDHTVMLYYRPGENRGLGNHVDCNYTLFTMSVSLGDDCEFVVGKPLPPSMRGRGRDGDRHGKPITIKMRSGDAIFFDGGTVPHQLTRTIEGTAPSWWDGAKVPNGSRMVLLFREKEQSLNGMFCPADKKKGKKVG